jgi:hypothetical protein
MAHTPTGKAVLAADLASGGFLNFKQAFPPEGGLQVAQCADGESIQSVAEKQFTPV